MPTHLQEYLQYVLLSMKFAVMQTFSEAFSIYFHLFHALRKISIVIPGKVGCRKKIEKRLVNDFGTLVTSSRGKYVAVPARGRDCGDEERALVACVSGASREDGDRTGKGTLDRQENKASKII